MNPFNEIKALQQRYRSNPEATEALKAGLAISSDYINELVSSLKARSVKQSTPLETLLATVNDLKKAFDGTYASTSNNTQADIEEAEYCKETVKNFLSYVESYIGKLHAN